MEPNFNRMINLMIENKIENDITRKEIIKIERLILNKFNFDLQFPIPTPFIERYMIIIQEIDRNNSTLYNMAN